MSINRVQTDARPSLPTQASAPDLVQQAEPIYGVADDRVYMEPTASTQNLERHYSLAAPHRSVQQTNQDASERSSTVPSEASLVPTVSESRLPVSPRLLRRDPEYSTAIVVSQDQSNGWDTAAYAVSPTYPGTTA